MTVDVITTRSYSISLRCTASHKNCCYYSLFLPQWTEESSRLQISNSPVIKSLFPAIIRFFLKMTGSQKENAQNRRKLPMPQWTTGLKRRTFISQNEACQKRVGEQTTRGPYRSPLEINQYWFIFKGLRSHAISGAFEMLSNFNDMDCLQNQKDKTNRKLN